jgi:photosystem II stability/assembly factor-like uncharacterized protein
LPKFLCDLFFGLEGDDDIGLAVGSDGRIGRTTDGGTNWTNITSGIDYDISAAAFETGGMIGVVVGEMGQVGRTMDAGLTWESTRTGSADLHDVVVRDMNYWAVGDLGSIYFSNDLGLTWAHQDSGTTENLNGIGLMTVDFGNNWISVIDEVLFDPFGFLKAVTFTEGGRVTAIGEEDVRFESNDDGLTFAKLKIIF